MSDDPLKVNDNPTLVPSQGERRPSPRVRPVIGISSCLIGAKVRYDGRSKEVAPIRQALLRRVDLYDLCPEVEAGLSVPRAPMTLVRSKGHLTLMTHDGNDDHTARMETFAHQRIKTLAELKLSGFVFKARSPSCGPNDAVVYSEAMKHDPPPVSTTDGLFALQVRAAFPGLPIVSEEKLTTDKERRIFLDDVMAYFAAQEPD